MPDATPSNPSPEEFDKSLERLKKESQEVKTRIEQEKHKHDLPLDSHLGDPAWEDDAADGHLDSPERDDD